jgi:DNA-directed RNA polymerase subunit beta'
MRTFHTGGVADVGDITSGLPRVEELFEARTPKGQAVVAEIDGQISILREGELRKIRIMATEAFRDEYDLPNGARIAVKDGQVVEEGAILANLPALAATGGENKVKGKKKKSEANQILARVGGRVERKARARTLAVVYEHEDVREYAIPAAARMRITEGERVQAGDRITEGSVNPQDMLRILGVDAVYRYMVTEVQQVYRAQGVNINDKHIEVIVRQMLRRVRIEDPGDSDSLAGELVDRFRYEEMNRRLIADGQEPASAQPVLLGVTKASLTQESWLAAASFQETTRVLTEAAVAGSVDNLVGLKENVIIGKLIPARAEIELPPLPEPTRTPEGELLGEFVGEQGMEGMTEELMRELGFTTQEPDSEKAPIVSEEPVAAVVAPDDFTAGFIAEPGDED